MRRIYRLPLPAGVRFRLGRKQVLANRQRRDAQFNAERIWRNARQTRCLRDVEATLKRMAGRTERCMYCEDSHGTDIEHFRPKTPFPECLFVWTNMLLCCAECGRLKGKQFPTDAMGEPLLIDPTVDAPWEHLDFDPETGNVVARFDLERNAFCPKGEKTVETLHLDRRESLARIYQRSYSSIVRIIVTAIEAVEPDADELIEQLRERDDNGILAWCFDGNGQHRAPISELRHRHPDIWQICRERLL
jgi:uncharacterized protein (TIGR02646 family)